MTGGGVLYACGVMGRSADESKFLIPVQGGVDSAGDCAYMSRVSIDRDVRFSKIVADQGIFALLDTKGGVWGWTAYRPFGRVTNKPQCIIPDGAADITAGASCITCVLQTGDALLIGGSTIAIAPPTPSTGYTQCDAAGSNLLLLDTQGRLHHLHCRNLASLPRPAVPSLVPGLDPADPVVAFSQGSRCAAAVTRGGLLYTWGDGLSGSLGLGSKVAEVKCPQRVPLFDGSGDDTSAVSVSCTKGQEQPKRTGKAGGQEGPRIHATSRSGRLYIAGTCHKGLGADHLHKVMAPSRDHTSFYRVGGPAADAGATPVPTGAAEDLAGKPQAACHALGMEEGAFGKGGETHYLESVNVVQSASAHIHSAAVSSCGKLFTWGCGSNGRTGLPAFMRGPGGSKRRMKCYISSPSAVPVEGRVLSCAVGKYWTLALVEPGPSRRGSKVA